MKNLKKVLALVVVFAMMLSTVAFAGSFPDVADDADYASAIETLAQLGFFTGDDKGNFNPDATITRAEYSVIVCRLLGLNAAGKANYADVAADFWGTGYVNAASNAGIVKGYGDGNFGPNDPVKYEEAITMLIRAIGYEPIAVSKGGYPGGYIAAASQYGILDGVDGSEGEGAKRSAVAVMTYNVLDVPVAEQTGFGTEVKYEILKATEDNDKVTLLTKLGIYKWEGMIVSNEKSAYAGTVQEKGYVQINVSDDFNNPLRAARFNTNKVGGAYGTMASATQQLKDEKGIASPALKSTVIAYFEEYSKGKFAVLAVEDAGYANEIVIDGMTVDPVKTNIASDEIWYYKDGASSSSRLKLDATPVTYIVNNKTLQYDIPDDPGTPGDQSVALDGTLITDIETRIDTPDVNADIKLIDIGNDGDYDIIEINVYQQLIAKKVNKAAGTITTYNNRTINLDIENEDAKVTVKDVNGKDFDFANVKEYDVVAVLVTPTSNPASLAGFDTASAMTGYDALDVIVAADSKVTGAVKGSTTDLVTSETIWNIDGTKYTQATAGYNLGSITKTSEGDFFIGIDGKIVGFEGTNAADGNYGFILYAYAPTGSRTAEITLLNKEGKVETLSMATEISFNGNTETAITAASFTSADFTGTEWATSVTGLLAAASGATVKEKIADFFSVNNVTAYSAYNDTQKATLIAERLIKYDTNSKGEIDEITLMGHAVDADFAATPVASGTEYKASTQKLNRSIADDVVIFDIDWTDLEDSTVKALDFLVDGDTYSAVLVDENDENEATAMVLRSADSKIPAGTPLAIITNVEHASDEDGADLVLATVLVEGKEKVITFHEDDTAKAWAGTTNMASLGYGDVILYTADANDVVTTYAVVGTGSTAGFAFEGTFAANAALVGALNTDRTEDDAYYYGILAKSGKNVDVFVTSAVENDSTFSAQTYTTGTTTAAMILANATSFSGFGDAQQYYFTNKGAANVVEAGVSIEMIYEFTSIEPDGAPTGSDDYDEYYEVLIRTNEDGIQEIITFKDKNTSTLY